MVQRQQEPELNERFERARDEEAKRVRCPPEGVLAAAAGSATACDGRLTLIDGARCANRPNGSRDLGAVLQPEVAKTAQARIKRENRTFTMVVSESLCV